MNYAKYPELTNILSPAIRSRSQQWVADKCGVSQEAVSGWKSGNKRPTIRHLAILVSHFDLDISQVAKAAHYDPSDIQDIMDTSIILRAASYPGEPRERLYSERVCPGPPAEPDPSVRGQLENQLRDYYGEMRCIIDGNLDNSIIVNWIPFDGDTANLGFTNLVPVGRQHLLQAISPRVRGKLSIDRCINSFP
jgi:hypothetical protein